MEEFGINETMGISSSLCGNVFLATSAPRSQYPPVKTLIAQALHWSIADHASGDHRRWIVGNL